MAFCHLPASPRLGAATPARCALTPSARPDKPHPLSRGETGVLLRRMLHVALSEEDFATAARLRDTHARLLEQDPLHALRARLDAAVRRQDFAAAAALRDAIETLVMHRHARRAKPRFPMGLVVRHRRLGYRMILFGVDFRCRAPGRKAEDAGVGLCERGFEQPWYHAAVDERDKLSGDNILYVAEDDVFPAPEGTDVRHPITRIMFTGLSAGHGYSWYVPGCRDDDDDDDDD